MHLRANERGLFLESFWLLWVTRLSLWLLPFRTCRRAFGPTARMPRIFSRRTDSTIKAVVQAIDRASRAVVRPTCLVRALVAESLLRRNGHDAILQIGLARRGAGLDGHAWVECNGKAVIGETELQEYHVAAPLTWDVQ
ncbi:MAG TPA: lasso peptide biosynthesis B2 protein [Terriglobales bacterium]|nr:lasso peptide biosynthesis B2 protein [Terriglobales bacterium]